MAGWGWGEGLGSPGVLVVAAGGTSSRCQTKHFSGKWFFPFASMPGQLPALYLLSALGLRALCVLSAAQQCHPPGTQERCFVTKHKPQLTRGVELFILMAQTGEGSPGSMALSALFVLLPRAWLCPLSPQPASDTAHPALPGTQAARANKPFVGSF